jgi:hypothetical protein
VDDPRDAIDEEAGEIEADNAPESARRERKRPKRPGVHWALMGLCWALFVAVWPDDLTGIIAHMRTRQWVQNDPAFNGMTFALMAWHVAVWGPGILWFSWLLYKRKHLGRRLGFALMGGECSVALVRIAFLNYLLWINYWPARYDVGAVWSFTYWLALLVVHGILLAYLWRDGHTLNR